MADQELDTKGLNCPQPIIKAKKALKEMATGATLRIESTDPGSIKDFESFCRVTGNELIESNENDGVYEFLIRVA